MLQTDRGSPTRVALIAGAGVISDAGSPQQPLQNRAGAALRHPPVQISALQMTAQVFTIRLSVPSHTTAVYSNESAT